MQIINKVSILFIFFYVLYSANVIELSVCNKKNLFLLYSVWEIK